jgi:hypothetical protein
MAAAVALAFVTVAGGGGDASRRVEPVVNGSDRHLYNRAEEIEARQDDAAVTEGSDRHLYNRAEEIEARQDDAAASDPGNAQCG